MVELLAPAGSMDALKAAIAAGANAIYVGGSRFNARAYATNFDIEELKEAVQLCHLHNVRLFVTVNTLYKESELADLYDYLCDLYNISVDALIVQDIGIMKFIQTHFKDFEIHASTQCSVHNKEGVRFFQDLGLKRVVVARENTLEEIKDMVLTGCEIEAFVHGALCVSYSGQCFMSQLIGKRSANRGMCAQPCRLPYHLYCDDNKLEAASYLMSCKDLCTIENIHELIKAGVKSFQIEGRMKRPEYVYAITNAYRRAIDAHDKPNIDLLKQMFNREFTRGYLFNETKIISPEFPGNRGVIVGNVVGYDKKNKKLRIKSSQTITQGDGIRIGFGDDGKILNKIYIKGKLANKAEIGTVYDIDYDRFVRNDTPIYRTTNIEIEKEIQKNLSTIYKKFPINIYFYGEVNKKAMIQIDDGTFNVTISSSQVLEAAQKPADLSRIETQLRKLGRTIYEANEVTVEVSSDTFVPITLINDLRRQACEALDQLRSNRKVRDQHEILPLEKMQGIEKQLHSTYIHVHDRLQLEALIESNCLEEVYLDLCDDFIEIKQQYPFIGLVVPTIVNEGVFKQIDNIISCVKDLKIAVNNIGAYYRYQDHVSLLLPGMNLSHHLSHNAFKEAAVMSLDMDSEDEIATDRLNSSYIKMTYGHIDVMTTKHCAVSYVKNGRKIEGCNQCRKGKYELEDRMNVKFPMLFDKHCIVHILSHKPISRKPTNHQYLRFTIESKEEIKAILRKYLNI